MPFVLVALCQKVGHTLIEDVYLLYGTTCPPAKIELNGF